MKESNILKDRLTYLMSNIPQSGKNLFLHLPKTGGQSIIKAFQIKGQKDGQFLHFWTPKDMIANQFQLKNRMISLYGYGGHLPWGFHKYVSPNIVSIYRFFLFFCPFYFELRFL